MKHMVIPDTQVKPDSDYSHMRWAGHYAAEKKPDVIVHLGDHWDMPSLSSYDVGKKSFEGRRYTKDIESGIDAMLAFLLQSGQSVSVSASTRRRSGDLRWCSCLVTMRTVLREL
jgi:hypothetical protein